MRVRTELSHADGHTMLLVAAILDYADTSEEVLEIAARLWPRLRVHHGHTHLRLMPSGEIEGDSIYVELA